MILLHILSIPGVQAPIIAHTGHSMMIVPFLATLVATALLSV
jgi:hypothetical protein